LPHSVFDLEQIFQTASSREQTDLSSETAEHSSPRTPLSAHNDRSPEARQMEGFVRVVCGVLISQPRGECAHAALGSDWCSSMEDHSSGANESASQVSRR